MYYVFVNKQANCARFKEHFNDDSDNKKHNVVERRYYDSIFI